jgi:hypothetical protein
MLRYKRQLSQNAFDYLLNEGCFIISEIKSARPISKPFTLDIQFREKDTLMVYMGITRILVINLDIKNSRLIFKADKAYSDPFLDTYSFANAPIGLIAPYLERIISLVRKNYFSNEAEGFYQNLICYLHGENATIDSPFIVIDRECVIGYLNNEEKIIHFVPIAKKYEAIIAREQDADPKRFGKPNGKKLGNELDLLAIDKDCNLCCIELKRGSSASGIYWGPIQVAVYKDIFNLEALRDIFPDIMKLVYQKVKLGLLPNLTNLILNGHSNFTTVKPILAIGSPNDNSSCWGTMQYLIGKYKPLLDCEVITFDKSGKVKTVFP